MIAAALIELLTSNYRYECDPPKGLVTFKVYQQALILLK
jgi:hypothetical protein